MSTMEHERMRFNSMTKVQLYTRLGKITHVDKLRNYARIARECGMEELAVAAEAKIQSMGGWVYERRGSGSLLNYLIDKIDEGDQKDIRPRLSTNSRKQKPTNHKRSLEF